MSNKEAVSQSIKLLLLDTEKANMVKIGNNYIPSEIVQKDMEKLDFFIIQHAVNKFNEISQVKRIKNTFSYLKSLIYNAISEAKIDIHAELRYECVI